MKNIILFIFLFILLTSCANKDIENEVIREDEWELISEEYEKDAQKWVDADKTLNSKEKKEITKTISEVIPTIKKDILVEARIITLDAKKWEYNQKEIRVKKWEKVIIKINNTDFDHWIAISGMKLVWNKEVILETSKTWTFEFRCENYCVSWHSNMKWTIIIE